MKILYVTDLHGIKWKFNRILDEARSRKIGIVINGGDLLPKHGNFFKHQPKFIRNYLNNYLAEFNQEKIYYLSYLGNDDLMIFDELYEEICDKYPYIIPIAQRKFELNGYEFIGMNWVADYPFALKDRCRKDTNEYKFQNQLGKGVLSRKNEFKEIEDWFSYAGTLPTIEDEMEILIKPSDFKKSIYIIHMPPANLGLDECGSGPSVGSIAIYNFFERYQPLLSLHGHIHESPEISGKWSSKIGKTICLQPGQLHKLSFVVIQLPEMKYERFEVEKNINY